MKVGDGEDSDPIAGNLSRDELVVLPPLHQSNRYQR
jgi:hypothetical protein